MNIKEFIELNEANMKADLAKLVSYNSVNADDAMPFGKANQGVLDAALKMMSKIGFVTKNEDYYCGYGEVGKGEKLIGILAHLDVVPAGEGWNTNPFEMNEKDGYLFGRGVSDDKGAAVASMYAVKYLLDEGFEFKKRLRLILGCNEECGSACIRHYVAKNGHIDYGFTPDGSFPGIFGEKGMFGGLVTGHNSKIIDIKGGEASNIVCKKVECVVPLGSFNKTKFETFLIKNNITFSIKEEENTTIVVNGISAHASTPDLGKNAISYLLEALYQADFNDSFVDYFHKWFGLDVHGEKLGFPAYNDEYSDTTINFGIVSKENNDIHISLDMRHAVTLKGEKVLELINQTKEEENEILHENKTVKPLFFDLDTPFIKALNKAYQDVTKDYESKMMVIGGGTYAKAIDNCIAWGADFSTEDNHIHDANERLNVESFKKQVELYVEAIKNLNELD